MKRRMRVTILGGVALAAVLMCGVFFFGGGTSQAQTRTQYEESITKLVPIGTQKGDVLTRLDAERLEHSPYSSDNRQILVIKRKTSRSLFVSSGVQAVLSFGEDDKLSRIMFKDVHTGP
jgi:hypothetical protein